MFEKPAGLSRCHVREEKNNFSKLKAAHVAVQAASSLSTLPSVSDIFSLSRLVSLIVRSDILANTGPPLF